MGQTVSQVARLNIVDHIPADTPLEPVSEAGFVWLYVRQVSSIPGTINASGPVWIKMSIFELVGLPVYDKQNLVHLQTTELPNGTLVGVYYRISSDRAEEAFTAVASNNGVLSITAFGVLPLPAKTSQDLYVQHATLAPQVPQVSSSDLLAEIIQRQTNPLDSRKLPDNVTITVGQTTTVTNNFNCVKKYSEDKKCKKYCKKCHYEH